MASPSMSGSFVCNLTEPAEKDPTKKPTERMLSALEELERNRQHMSAPELREKRRSLLVQSLEEILDSESAAAYGQVLMKVKEELEHKDSSRDALQRELVDAKNALSVEKRRGDKLEKENVELTKEYDKQAALINSQRVLIKELKRQSAETSNVSTGTAAAGKLESLMGEIKTLYKENSRLDLLAKKLQYDLKQSKVRESTLTKLLKGNSAMLSGLSSLALNSSVVSPSSGIKENIVLESNDLNRTECEKTAPQKTRAKVVVPPLDFSKLPQRKQAQVTVVQCESTSDPGSDTNKGTSGL